MRRPLFIPLLNKLRKIYFSNSSNKEMEYKRVVFYTLKDMGGVYIKFLQAICVTQKFMEGWGGPKEFEVFNKVQKELIDFEKYLPHMEFFHMLKKCRLLVVLLRNYIKVNLKLVKKWQLKF
ncbi:MAG: hypothetical protein V8R01_03790 [Bacilli bacterium]